MRLLTLLTFMLFVLVPAMHAQDGAVHDKANVGDTLVSLVNIYPGSEIYELEGHTLLRVAMPQADLAISYGTYDFNQPNFAYRFTKGETDYWVSLLPWQAAVYEYQRENRRMVEHVIDMTPEQKQRLLELLINNFEPQNRTYRYNYVKDNCATRPLRMVELAMADSILLGPAPEEFLEGSTTFRSVMQRYHQNYPWYQFGIDLALGTGVDYPISRRAMSFAPIVLDHQLVDATLQADGRPLVKETRVVIDLPEFAAVGDMTPWYATPMAVALLLLIVTLVVTYFDIRRRKVSRWFDTFLYGLYGLMGLIIAFLVFISVHEATSPNYLLLWLNPLCLIVAIFTWLNRCQFIVFSYQIINFVALIVLAVIWLADVQVCNLAFIPLIVCDALRAAYYIYHYSLRCKKHD